MYGLIPAATDLAGRPDVEVLHRYESFVLVRVAGDKAGSHAGLMPLEASDLVRVNGGILRVPEGEFIRQQTPRVVLRFAGPIAAEWVRALEDRGVALHFWCPPFGVCAEIPRRVSTQALRKALPALLGMQPYRRDACTRRLPERTRAARQHGGLGRDWIDVVCFREAEQGRVRHEIESVGGAVNAASKYKLRVRYAGDLAALRAVRGVKIADPARAAVLAWTPLYEATGVRAAGSPDSSLSGRGQVVAIADTGLDTGDPDGNLHPDLAGRVRFISSWPVNASWNPYLSDGVSDDGPADRDSGHGTHVAGLVLGSGVKSNGKYRGLAPGAELVFQAIEQYTPVAREFAREIPAGYYLSGRPLDLRELFRQAREQGARIHVNAWGDPARGSYTDDSYEADLFLSKNTDAIVLFAAGNEGADRDGNRVLDSASLYAPASAKNVVAVGAVEGPRAGVGFRGSWAGFDRDNRRFRHRRDRGDAISGEPDHIALISSTGPTRDGRIKPDVCAPGTNLPAPKSQATAARGWGLASPLPYYMYLGGTSMATAVAGGAVALLRQAWTESLGRAPSGPALKALLVFGARALRRRDGSGPESRQVSGFGRIMLEHSLPGAQVSLVDAVAQGLATGASRAYSIRISQPQPFRAVLAWYDLPGEYLINDLDLCLTGAGGVRVWGNHSPGEHGAPDRANTLECIAIERLQPGDYRLEVIAANVPGGAQGYALACTHAGSSAIRGPALPVAWLRGIGSTYRQRLQAAGITTLAQLRAPEIAVLAGLLRTSERRLEPVARRLQVLQAALSASPAAAERTLTLRDIGRLRTPAGIDTRDWTRLRARWQPLLDVFDKRVHRRIHIGDLFRGE